MATHLILVKWETAERNLETIKKEFEAKTGFEVEMVVPVVNNEEKSMRERTR